MKSNLLKGSYSNLFLNKDGKLKCPLFHAKLLHLELESLAECVKDKYYPWGHTCVCMPVYTCVCMCSHCVPIQLLLSVSKFPVSLGYKGQALVRFCFDGIRTQSWTTGSAAHLQNSIASIRLPSSCEWTRWSKTFCLSQNHIPPENLTVPGLGKTNVYNYLQPLLFFFCGLRESVMQLFSHKILASLPLRAGCHLLCLTKCCGHSCVKHSTWNSRPKCRAPGAWPKRTLCSWRRNCSTAIVPTSRTTAPCLCPGPSSTGWATQLPAAV
jgi:hypothetical protein